MINGTGYRLTAEIARQSQLSQDIARAQTEISTNTRLQAPSDDPAAWSRVSDIRRSLANQTVWATNVQTATAAASQSDTMFSGLQNSMNRALELMTQASSGTLNDSDRAAITTELRGIASDITTAMNTKDSSGNPLFSDGTPLQVPVGNGVFITPVASKAQIFQGVSTSSGPQDIVSIINAAADATALTDPTARSAALASSLSDVQAAATRITTAYSDQGVRESRLNKAGDALTTSSNALTAEQSTLSNTDVTATVANLQSMMLSLQAAQAAFAKVNQESLFSLLT